jgi:hypothetical protein
MDTAEVKFLGMRLTANMTVLRVGDGLLLHSPIALTPERRAAVDRLGPVTHLYSPNLFHHLRVGDWAAAYPAAKVHAPPGLARKRPDLRIDRIHSAGSAFGADVDELPIHGFRLEETVLFHRPSRTLVVADLVHNIGRPSHSWTRIYSTLARFYDRVAISRVIRWTAFADRVAARRSVDEVLALPFDRIVVGHGPPLIDQPHAALASAYSWLAPRRALRTGLNPSGCA